jgi:hypothetical protein
MAWTNWERAGTYEPLVRLIAGNFQRFDFSWAEEPIGNEAC